jgi:hypothetical protein
MKFNWGTGIAIFLVLFLGAAAAFIIFAINQDVSLVHKDYYEKGVDYSEQMNVTSRSAIFREKIQVVTGSNGITVALDSALAVSIDSGKVVLYRPSDKNLDLEMPLVKPGPVEISADKLEHGRYILKTSWYTNGLKYEIDNDINFR